MLVDFGSLSGSLIIVLAMVAAIVLFGSLVALLLIRIFDAGGEAEPHRLPGFRTTRDSPINKAA